MIGAWQGFWVAYVGVPAFIVTLAGMLLFRGGNQFIGNANTIPVPEGFRDIGAGFLPEVGPDTGYNNLTLLLGLLVCVAVVVREWRARRTRREMAADVAPMWISVIRVAVPIVVVVVRDPAVRRRPGRDQLPDLRDHPRRPGRRSTPSSPATPPAAGTSTRSAATPAPPSCPASSSSGSTSW